MVGTIAPMVHGHRIARFVRGILNPVGGFVGGSALGAVLGQLGSWLQVPVDRRATGLLVGAVCGAYLLRELGLVATPAPERRHQVSRGWVALVPQQLASFTYGASLGVGILTHIPATAYYPLLLLSVISTDPWIGALVLGVFGAARGVPVLAISLLPARCQSGTGLVEVCRTIDRHAATAKLLNGLALGALAAASFGGGGARRPVSGNQPRSRRVSVIARSIVATKG